MRGLRLMVKENYVDMGRLELLVPEQPEEFTVSIDREITTRRLLIDYGSILDARDEARREVARLQSMLSTLGFCYICGESQPCLSNSEAHYSARLAEYGLPADTTEEEN